MQIAIVRFFDCVNSVFFKSITEDVLSVICIKLQSLDECLS